MRYFPLISLLFAAALQAQTLNPLAYPQDTLTGSGGNLVPFGALNSGSFVEGHTQLLVPADHLPSTGGALMGMSVNSQVFTGSVTYTSLNIDVGTTTATTLNTTFAQNLPSPTSVLAAQNLSVTYTQRAWTPIMFTTPFVYPGTGNLVIDIRKVMVTPSGLVTMQTTTDQPRTDLPAMIYAFGGVGSGASTATTATVTTNTLQFRLLWSSIPTMTLLSDRNGPGGNSGNTFSAAGGGSITITTYGTASSVYLTQAGFALGPPVSIPPVHGLLYVNGVTLGIAFLNASGNDARNLPIPANPGLVGLHVAFQSGVLDAVSSVASWTCASDAIINP